MLNRLHRKVSIEEPGTRLWSYQWLIDREQEHAGVWKCLKEQMVEDPVSFSRYVRMDTETFLQLAELIKEDIQKMNTNFRKSISYHMRLAITLHFLATGETYHSLKCSFRIGYSTVSNIIAETCKAICKHLKAEQLSLIHSTKTWMDIEKGFRERWNLPNCIGSIDGKHITINAVPNSGSYYFNYKGTNSIVLMAVVDSNRRFIYVDIGCNGRISDGGVFSRTNLYKYLEDNSNPLHIPEPQALPGRNKIIPYYFVGDDAFSLKKYMMKPYPYRGMNLKQRVYNYRQSRARITVENAFGILSSRFQIFKKPMFFLPNKVDLFVMTACILYNYLMKDIETEEGNDIENNMNNITRSTVHGSTREAREMRDEIAEYCVNEGNLEWQYNKI